MGPSIIYVYGDLEMARKVVQGMNAVFNAPGWYANQGAQYDAGGFFSFGLMVVIWGTVLAWFIHQRFNLGPVLLAFLIYVVMTVPRTDLWIEDIYTGGVVIVEDTPIGIAVLASLGSTLSKRMADQFDIQFTPLSAGASTMYQSSFASPLRLMLSLRKIVPRGENVYMEANLARYMATCPERSTGMGGSTLNGAVGKVAWLLDHPKPSTGPVTYQSISLPDGVGLSCSDAATRLKNDLSSYLNDVGDLLSEDLNAAIVSAVGQSYVGNPNYDITTVEAGLQDILGASAAEGRVFMQDLLFHKLSMAAMECGVATNSYEFRECTTSILDAAESAKTDTAMKASIFQKVMIPLMNILTYLFFGLAPIVIVLAVAMGIQGVGILMKFGLFGFWVQSWVPTAIFINYIIFEQTKGALQNFYNAFKQGAYNPNHFYDVISTKLMVASEVLSATPLITLAVMGGGAMAMTSIASSAGKAAAAKSDSSNASPKMRKTEPLHSFAGLGHSNSARNIRAKLSDSHSGKRGMFTSDAEVGLRSLIGSANISKITTASRQAASQRVNNISSKLNATRGKLASATAAAVNSVGSSLTGQHQTSTQGSFSSATASSVAHSLGYDKKLSNEQQKDIMTTLSGGISGYLRGSIDKDKLIEKIKGLGAKLGLDVNARTAGSIADRLINGASEGHNANLQNLKEGRLTLSDAGSLMRQAIETDTAQIQQLTQETEQYQQQYEEALTEQESISNTAQQLESVATTFGSNLADTLIGHWQSGGSAPTGYNQQRFNDFVDNMKQKGFLGKGENGESMAQELKAGFAQRLEAAHARIQQLGYGDTMTRQQRDALASWVAYNGTSMPSTRAQAAYSKLQLNMAKDYLGQPVDLGRVKGAADKVADHSERIGKPDKKPLEDLVNSKGNGPLHREATGAYQNIRASSPTPEGLQQDGADAAQARSGTGKGQAQEHFENSPVSQTSKGLLGVGEQKMKESNLLKSSRAMGNAMDWTSARYRQVKFADLQDAAWEAAQASRERDPLDSASNYDVATIQVNDGARDLTGDSSYRGSDSYPDPNRVIRETFQKEAKTMNLSPIATQRYVDTRMAAFDKNSTSFFSSSGKFSGAGGRESVLESQKPTPHEYATKEAYEEAFFGWNVARTVATERDGAPGLPGWGTETEQVLKNRQTSTGSSGRPFFNPAGLGNSSGKKPLEIVIDKAAND